ncbi:MAG: hypothetical protein A49_24670 [Methyloceanibacter sp.]|nr:MAG: hypothetical protein A49_24670 [Methyloceanibacter sp.]
MTVAWPTKRVAITSIQLDHKNPRLGRETTARAPRDIIQYLFEHDKAMDVAESIATRGYFPNEPILVVREDGKMVAVEGNRRLAALKALKEPGLLQGARQRQIQRLAKRIEDPAALAKVPVTLAPSRRATDRQIAGRHVGTPVLAWQAENRASFILDKLNEGYTNQQLEAELGFRATDIQEARQTRAIADMTRSIELPQEVKAKLDSPRAKIFTTVGRVFDSTVGRSYLQIEPDPEHGIRGKTTKAEFLKGFTKLVEDIALARQSSRTLNSNEDIEKYFKSWEPKDRPVAKRGSFVPSDIIKGKSAASKPEGTKKPTPKRTKQPLKKVLPRDLRVHIDDARLIDIRDELVRLNRVEFPNAGAVLLRVFFELTAVSYLKRTGEMDKIIQKLVGKSRLPFGTPTMKQLVPALIQIAKENLGNDATKVEKAIKYDASAPFTLSDLHAFVHQSGDLPSERDILQFWLRTEPLLRLMLSDTQGHAK